MRIPATSNPRPNPMAGQTQGTQGGKSAFKPTGRKPGGRKILLGDEIYLWILLFIEVGGIAWARQQFRRHHGG